MSMGDPQRGDVVVFKKPDEERYFIKRVIGLPGDTIRYVDRKLFINGKRVNKQFTHRDTDRSLYSEVVAEKPYQIFNDIEPRFKSEGEWVVPDNQYFMMGDNRDNSSDSRVWGTVPRHLITGKAMAVWMKWDSVTSLPSFSDARLIH